MRKLLLYMRDQDKTWFNTEQGLNHIPDAEHHALLLADEGLLVKGRPKDASWEYYRLTARGHDCLDTIADDSYWTKATEKENENPFRPFRYNQ